MQKHAYLILAHNEFNLLEKLIKFLDDERNDIYIHIDKKINGFDFDKFSRLVKHSVIEFVPRVSVKWGDISMVKAEYSLLSAALANQEYAYLHLLSGVDVPLKNLDEISAFFEKNNGVEFVNVSSRNLTPTEYDRVRTYHFASGRRNILNRAVTKAESLLSHILKIDRAKNVDIRRGSQWFSITGEFAKYLMSQKKFVMKQFNHTLIPDEFFMQTVVVNSPFKDRVYDLKSSSRCCDPVRYTDWNRGAPYTFTIDDYDELIGCGCLFARKFSSVTDCEIIDKLYERLNENGEELF